jgi:hypothetical protein
MSDAIEQLEKEKALHLKRVGKILSKLHLRKHELEENLRMIEAVKDFNAVEIKAAILTINDEVAEVRDSLERNYTVAYKKGYRART